MSGAWHAVLAPTLAAVGLEFGPWDYLVLIVFALTRPWALFFAVLAAFSLVFPWYQRARAGAPGR